MKTIRFAIVGFGNIAKTHIVALKALPVLKKLPYLLVIDTLVTRNPEGNRIQAEAAGFAHVTDSLEEALASRKIDVVDICTPNAMHLEAAEAAEKAGKAIYCEKPLTDRFIHSERLVELSRNGAVHQVALVYRYHPAVLRIREALKTGLLGEVLQCRCSYRRSGYLDASRPVSWRLNESMSGGGAISDLGVHVLDLLYHLFGEIDQADGQLRTFVKKRPLLQGGSESADISVDDWALMNVSHCSGVQATAEVSRIAWGSEAFQLDIVGSKGSVSVDLEKEYVPRFKLLDGSVPPVPQPTTLVLSTDDKSTLGMSVDCHLGALNHYLHRLAGADQWEKDLSPSLEDCLRAERWIEQVLAAGGKNV